MTAGQTRGAQGKPLLVAVHAARKAGTGKQHVTWQFTPSKGSSFLVHPLSLLLHSPRSPFPPPNNCSSPAPPQHRDTTRGSPAHLLAPVLRRPHEAPPPALGRLSQ